jgi:hypothetical protein
VDEPLQGFENDLKRGKICHILQEAFMLYCSQNMAYPNVYFQVKGKKPEQAYIHLFRYILWHY